MNMSETSNEMVWCPYPGCPAEGTEDEVDEHRAYTHRDEPQQGSNLRTKPSS
jgi:hypothetical protein